MDDDIRKLAEEFARANKKQIAKELTDTSKYIPDDRPVSVFMAGSPGAGKTEYSKNLIYLLEKNKEHKVIRIDGDDLRQYLPGYTGKNSYLFQGAISIIVDKIHDMALENKQTFILDGTLSKYEKAVNNIKRSLNKDRSVFIFYVYQKPEIAWKFTVAREAKEGRSIPKDVFIEQFLSAQKTIDRIRADFDDKVIIFLVKKNFENHFVEDIVEIEPGGYQVDYYLKPAYTESDLEKLL